MQHLKLLSIFHYVVAVLMALIACFPIIHFVVGVMMIVSPNTMAGKGSTPPPAELGWLFIFIAGGIIFVGWTGAICLMLAGWFLRRCKHYLFCMVMAGFVCLFNPFGTILGIFTIIILIRPSVKRLFETGGLPGERDEEEDEPRFPDDYIIQGPYNIRGER
ncbi:MAG TPA: hypothetical protein VN688_19335 [Gemmataceae bacterium]|nr:hypothetical protein [Gemmataceae bacterium]